MTHGDGEDGLGGELAHFSWVSCEAVLPWSTITVCETGKSSRTCDAMMMLTVARDEQLGYDKER